MFGLVALTLLLAGAVLPVTAWADDVSTAQQPIEFPHSRHAGKYKINCMYCHTFARRSKVAGIPPVSKCIGCHLHLPSVRNKPRIKKLFSYWEQKKPIPWLKVHDMPDFVYFTHKRHIQRFIFQDGRPTQQVCGMCHGDVKTFSVGRKVRAMTMGWCLSCHKQFQGVSDIGHPKPAKRWMIPVAPTDQAVMDVDFPQLAVMDPEHPKSIPNSVIEKLNRRLPDSVKAKIVHAPHDCWKCHF
ncbi:MAG: cytochrome c3 family protein [Mariprofundales bacterium]|nr:cytochrome c3 family protein [Mariprofundales bacterium]